MKAVEVEEGATLCTRPHAYRGSQALRVVRKGEPIRGGLRGAAPGVLVEFLTGRDKGRQDVVTYQQLMPMPAGFMEERERHQQEVTVAQELAKLLVEAGVDCRASATTILISVPGQAHAIRDLLNRAGHP
jgi:hypothetical protein